MSLSRFSAISVPSLVPASFFACGLAYIVSDISTEFDEPTTAAFFDVSSPLSVFM